MLFFKNDYDMWDTVKTFVVFLNRLPEFPVTFIHNIEEDEICKKELLGIHDDSAR